MGLESSAMSASWPSLWADWVAFLSVTKFFFEVTSGGEEEVEGRGGKGGRKEVEKGVKKGWREGGVRRVKRGWKGGGGEGGKVEREGR